MKKYILYILNFLGNCLFVLIYGSFCRRKYYVFEKEKLIYISTPKCGYSSIKKSLGALKRNNSEFTILHRLTARHISGDYFIFTVIRNPLRRIESCYLNTIQNREKNQALRYYLFGYLWGDLSYSEFLRKIFSIPDFFRNHHFRSIYSVIGGEKIVKKTKLLMLENIERDFEPLRLKYGLPKLEKINVSPNRIHLEIESNLLKIFLEKYKNDYKLIEIYNQLN